MLYPRASKTRRVMDLSGLWNFRFDTQQDFILMPVPAAFADIFTDKEAREYTGDMWYERELFVPAEWRGMAVSLRFEAATHRAQVFLNGKEIGSHEGGFLPFTIDISEKALYDEANTLTVKINNELREECLPVGRTAMLPDGRKMAKGYFDFFNYSGLQRPVKLVAVPKEHIADVAMAHEIHGADAVVAYEVTTTGGHPVRVSVYDENGNPVAQGEGAKGELCIQSARLWDVHNAYLYQFVFEIIDGESILDAYREDIGIRTFEIRGKDFLLNGKPVYLKGFGKHEEADIVGRGLNLGVLKRDFELMKWCGANSFRTAHYPYSEEVYQLADREGILVIDEAPAVGMMASTLNFFDAASGPQTNFFGKETTATLLQNHKNAIRDLICRDKNHACVIAWCLANEPETTDDDALPYFEKIFEFAKGLDPQHRPLTYTSIMSAMPDKCKCFHLCDFISLNRYYGWYVFGGNEIGIAKMAFHHEMQQWAKLVPDKPFIFSEYGADTHDAENKLPSVMWSQEYQVEYLKMCEGVFDAYDFVRGEQVWAFADFQTGEGTMRVDGNKKGIFTRQRQPKAAAFHLKKRWEALPADYKAIK